MWTTKLSKLADCEIVDMSPGTPTAKFSKGLTGPLWGLLNSRRWRAIRLGDVDTATKENRVIIALERDAAQRGVVLGVPAVLS